MLGYTIQQPRKLKPPHQDIPRLINPLGPTPLKCKGHYLPDIKAGFSPSLHMADPSAYKEKIFQRLTTSCPRPCLFRRLAASMETSVSSTWDWEQTARFGFLTETMLVYTHNNLNMPRFWHILIMMNSRRVGGYCLHLWFQGGTSPNSRLWIVVLMVFNTTMHLRALIELWFFLFFYLDILWSTWRYASYSNAILYNIWL